MINLDNEQYNINIIRLPDNMFEIKLIDKESKAVVAEAKLSQSYRYSVYYMDKFVSRVRGCGKILLDKILDSYQIWFICRLNGSSLEDVNDLYKPNEGLLAYYRGKFEGRLGEYVIDDSIWGCSASLFFSLGLDKGRFINFVDSYFSNGKK